MGGCFFTTDTAGAEHGNFLLFIRTEFLFDILRPLAEGIGVRIFRSFKCSDFHFILVTGINHPDIGVPNQGVPFLRVNILPNCFVRINRGIAQGDNFRTGNDSQTIKGRSGAFSDPGVEVGKPRVFPNMVQEFPDSIPWTGNGGIDSLGGKNHGAEDVQLLSPLPKFVFPFLEFREFSKLIKGGDGLRCVLSHGWMLLKLVLKSRNLAILVSYMDDGLEGTT